MLMNNRKRCAILFTAAIILFSMLGVSRTDTIKASTSSNEKAAETSEIELFYNKDTDSISVLNKRNGSVWSSVLDDEKYNLDGLSPLQLANCNSLLAITYTDVKSNEGKLNKVYSAIEQKNVRTKSIDNGIAVEYEFVQLNIKIEIEFRIKEDYLYINIPADKVLDNDRHLLMSLELMPGFGASNHTDEGYILYPDGCGGLLRYDQYNNRPNNLTTLTWNVYSPSTENIDQFYQSTGIKGLDKGSGRHQASLPVYGVKKGNDGFLAFVTEGEANTSINVSPEGHILPFNRTAFSFRYRNTFDIVLSNISAGKDTTNIRKGTKVDKDINQQSYEVIYKFLTDEQATYSGMANAYRDYLVKNDLIKDSESEAVPLAIDLFCGVIEERLLFNKYISMTTFEQAQEIVQELLDRDVSNIYVTLKGWSKNGYGHFPTNWPADRRLGGNKALGELAEFAEMQGATLFVQTNPILAVSGKGNFSRRADVVYQGNKLPFSDRLHNFFILNARSVAKRVTDLLQNISKLGNLNISLDALGKHVYSDYSDNSYNSRVDTADKWDRIFYNVKENNNKISIEGGNSYSFKYADYLYNLPIETSGTNISDEEVPFLQMVIHGRIPYTANPGNLFYDEDLQKLKWIEYGCLPYYELTYKQAVEMKHTIYNKLYSSFYKDWLDKAVSTYYEYSKRLGGLWNEEMIEHKRISDTLVTVKYSNNTTVYINYSDNDLEFDGIQIPAKDFTVIQ